MASVASREVSRHLNTLFHCGAAGQLSDAELLEQFVAGRDETAEAAFAALVERHGVMVLGVCRRVLGNRDEADDAFQATFLVLARKAAAIARREQLASWLHGVARRASLDARARATRRKAMEKRLGAMVPVEPPDQTMASELRTILDEELARLPERHRAAIVLCELEALSRREAAARLGISEGTLSSRLARAKSRLRDRLTRRGFALSAATLAAVLNQEVHAVILPPVLVDSTIRVATLVAAGSSLAGVVSTSVATLSEGVLKAMLLAKLKFAVLGLVTLAVVSTSVGVLAQDGPDRPSDNDRLKAVEHKLDRLLEVLGGSSRRTTSPDAPPTLETAPRIADVTQPPAPAIAPLPPVPPAPPIAPSADAIPSPGDGPTPSPRALPAPKPGRSDLAGRVGLLERRLGELERRFSELERRINVSHAMPGTFPSIPSSRAPGAGVDMNPVHGGGGPFVLDTAASDLAAPAPTLPSADPGFSINPPHDAADQRPATPEARPGIN
jgi:RNA polymerase sigma factor (sigma-70 family)